MTGPRKRLKRQKPDKTSLFVMPTRTVQPARCSPPRNTFGRLICRNAASDAQRYFLSMEELSKGSPRKAGVTNLKLKIKCGHC